MKKFFTLILSLFILTTYAQTSNLNVEVSNLESQDGNILIALYNSENGYPHKNEFKKGVVEPNGKTVNYTFKNLPNGVYAVAVLHDENKNGKMDVGLFGPKEGYGFSNNAKGILSAPPFKKTSFNLNADKTIKIKL